MAEKIGGIGLTKYQCEYLDEELCVWHNKGSPFTLMSVNGKLVALNVDQLKLLSRQIRKRIKQLGENK